MGVSKNRIGGPSTKSSGSTSKSSTSSSSTVNVQANGSAPKGLSVGTSVNTAGGTYQITGVNKDGSYQSKLVGSPTSGASGAKTTTAPTTGSSYAPKATGSTGGSTQPVTGSSYAPSSGGVKAPTMPAGTQSPASFDSKYINNAADLSRIAALKANYTTTNDANTQNQIHNEVEQIRAKYGYSGGGDGETYTKLAPVYGPPGPNGTIQVGNKTYDANGYPSVGNNQDVQTFDDKAENGQLYNENDYQNWLKGQQQQQPQDAQQQIQASAVQTGNIMGSIASIGSQYAQQSNEAAAAVAAQYTQMVKLLDGLESQVLGQIREQMNGDDPGLKSAIDIIKQEAIRMRDESLQDLNSRGLVQSGVYAEMLDRLNKNELTQVQQVVGQRFGDLQNQLNQAVMSMAQARIGALSGNQNAINSMMMNDRNMQANIGLQGLGLQLQNKGIDQQYSIAQMQNDTQRYGIDTQAATSKYNTDTNAQTSMYNTNMGYASSIYGANAQKDASIYGTDKKYASDIYGIDTQAATSKYSTDVQAATSKYSTDKSYAANMAGVASQNAANKLAADKFAYTKSFDTQARIDEHMKVATAQTPTIIDKMTKGDISYNQAIQQVNNSGLEFQARQYMVDEIGNAYKKWQDQSKAYAPSGNTGGLNYSNMNAMANAYGYR